MGAEDVLDAARQLLADGAASKAVRLLRGAPREGDRSDPEHLLLLARALIAEGRDAEALPIAEAVPAMRLADPATEALALALTAHIRGVLGDPEAAGRLARRALRLAATRRSEAALRASAVAHEVLSRRALFLGDLHESVASAVLATAAATALGGMDLEGALTHEAFVRMQADQFVAAEAVIERLPLGREPLTPAAARRELTLGAIHFHAGDWASAAVRLDPRPVRAAGVEIGDVDWGTFAGLLAVLHVHADRVDEAAALLGEGTPVLATGPRPWLLWGALLVAEVRRDATAMAALVDRLLATINDLRSPLRLRVVGPDVVRILRGLDDPGRAASVVAELERLAAGAGIGSVTAASRLCRGLLRDDRDALADAVHGFAAARRPLEEATALEALAMLDMASGPAAARDAGRRALAMYEGMGAHRDARRLGRALRDAGVATGRTGRRSGRSVGWESLSSSERAVAGLVAEGLTNAEIGARLAISRRTVESHVSHVLNKLSLSGRAAIAAAATRAAAERGQAG